MPASQHDLARLEREFRTYRRRTGLIHLALLALALTAFTTGSADVLRVRGLIVEDSTGAPRVVIGAPLELAGYTAAQAGAGIAVLTKDGHLQAAMGAPTPAPRFRNGHRVGSRFLARHCIGFRQYHVAEQMKNEERGIKNRV